jgi:hypothetical protein
MKARPLELTESVRSAVVLLQLQRCVAAILFATSGAFGLVSQDAMGEAVGTGFGILALTIGARAFLTNAAFATALQSGAICDRTLRRNIENAAHLHIR